MIFERSKYVVYDADIEVRELVPKVLKGSKGF